MSTDTLKAAALAMARAGLYVLPVKAGGKAALVTSWQSQASTDPEQVKGWWTRWPAANIGLHVGLSGVAVVDVDPRNGGEVTFAALVRKYGDGWVSHLSASTGGGGVHYFYHCPDPAGLPAQLGPGIDLKRGNAYVLVAPSVTEDEYMWDRDSLVDGIDFLPTVPAWFYGGKPSTEAVDTDDWAATVTQSDEETSENVDRVKSALACLSADCDRSTWRDVIFAVMSTGWGCADDLARGWSMTAPERFTDDGFANVVDNFNAEKAGGIGLGTLFKMAAEAGWTDPRSKKHSVNLLRGDSIKPEPITWLWDGWLACGKLALLAGAPGTGKTTIAGSMAATVTRGGEWPDGSKAASGRVVIWSGEDDAADTLIPRLMADKAALDRVHFVGDATGPDGPRPFDPARDVPSLVTRLKSLGDVRLIVVDPIVSAVAGDSHKNAEVRRGLQPLVDLAGEIGACLVGITHFTKGTAGRDTTERVTGSLAFAALARTVMATACDTVTGDSLITRSKSNIGPTGGGFRYALEQVTLDNGIRASRVHWGEALEGSARELIQEAEGEPGKPATGKRDVNAWLRDLLMIGPIKAREVYEAGAEAGHGERKLQRALAAIGGMSYRDGFGKGASITWSLPGYEGKEVDGDGL